MKEVNISTHPQQGKHLFFNKISLLMHPLLLDPLFEIFNSKFLTLALPLPTYYQVIRRQFEINSHIFLHMMGMLHKKWVIKIEITGFFGFVLGSRLKVSAFFYKSNK